MPWASGAGPWTHQSLCDVCDSGNCCIPFTMAPSPSPTPTETFHTFAVSLYVYEVTKPKRLPKAKQWCPRKRRRRKSESWNFLSTTVTTFPFSKAFSRSTDKINTSSQRRNSLYSSMPCQRLKCSSFFITCTPIDHMFFSLHDAMDVCYMDCVIKCLAAHTQV